MSLLPTTPIAGVPISFAAEALAAAISESQAMPRRSSSTGTITAIVDTDQGRVVTVSGLADRDVACQSTGVFDALYDVSGPALIGQPVIVLTVAGTPFALTSYKIGF